MRKLSVFRCYLLPILTFSLLMAACGGSGGGAGGSVVPSIIASGRSDTLIMMSDGSVLAWGRNLHGQLGTSVGVPQPTPFEVGSIGNLAYLAAGHYHSLGIREEGSLWAWGRNAEGQLGTSVSPGAVPVQVGTSTDWSTASGGAYHSVALKEDGSLWAWGSNDYGQLGTDQSINELLVPSRVGTGSDWRWISSGESYNLAIKNGGTLWAWGYNYNSECGTDSALSEIDTPNRIGTNAQWSSVSAGGTHGLAIRTDGTLWGWGDNSYGRIGVPGDLSQTSPVQVGSDADWKMVSAGGDHTVALKKSGSLWAWGRNNYGQLGTNLTIGQLDEPTRIGTKSDWKLVRAGNGFTVAVKDDGSVWSWGTNAFGELGNGLAGNKSSPAMASSVSPAPWDTRPPAAGGSHGLIIKTDGTLWAWGSNASGALATSLGHTRIVPLQVGSDMDWEMAWAGGSTSLGLKDDGTLLGWGDNRYSQLGSPGEDSSAPLEVGVFPDLMDLDPGYEHILLVRGSTLWAWGRNDHGQCGTDAAIVTVESPARIGTDEDWQAVAGGDRFSLALKTDGSLWAWGYNSYGQLGTDLAVTEIDTPSRIGTATDWNKVAAGFYSSFAIKEDGSLWAWGRNDLLQLGDDLLPSSTSVPSRIGTAADWRYIAGGERHTLGIKDDGSLWAWGYNYNDILGIGTGHPSQVSPPVQIGSDYDWAYADAGENFSIGIKTDGTLYGWGLNDGGQIPDGTACVDIPQQVY